MYSVKEINDSLNGGIYDERLKRLYCVNDDGAAAVRERISRVLANFTAKYAHTEAEVFSAPGRIEIGGNHTDHQHGHVLAASVNLDITAAAAPNGTNTIRILSHGYPEDIVSLDNLECVKAEENTSAALIRGVAAKITEMGYTVGGFDAYTHSNVPKGSGLSSSAAFEVLVGVIINSFFCNGEISDIEIAKIGKYAENKYFGKPCGLMDQTASAVGGVTAIDFNNPEKPEIEKIDCDFAKHGYAVCIVDTGADHADLTSEYAAIPMEMGIVASVFGAKYLREVPRQSFMASISALRDQNISDRAILRAMHYYADDITAVKEAKALKEDNFDEFLRLVTLSGNSSFKYLQNIYCSSKPYSQPVSVCIAAAEYLLDGRGAVRVHGGGFAGTIQAFVPLDMLDEFSEKIKEICKNSKCHTLSIRPEGGVRVI